MDHPGSKSSVRSCVARTHDEQCALGFVAERLQYALRELLDGVGALTHRGPDDLGNPTTKARVERVAAWRASGERAKDFSRRAGYSASTLRCGHRS